MKVGSINGLRSRQLSLTLVAFACTTVLFFIWEKTPTETVEIIYAETYTSGVSHDRPKIDMHLETVQEEIEKEEEEDGAKRILGSSMNVITQKPEESVIPLKEADPVSNKSLEITEDMLPMKNGKRKNQRTECNYGKGKWVHDESRPLYSGFRCKDYLAPMWACRLTQRLDFAYESFRWQPENCDMPRFERSTFLKRMKDKTLAFVGDSLGRQQFQSMMCMATGGEDPAEVEDVGWEYGLVVPRGAKRPDGWAYRFTDTNTTILYYWSATLCDLEPLDVSDPKTEVAMHLDRPSAFLSRYLHKCDVLVLNTGHHWNRGKLRGNRWVMYVNGKPNENRVLAEMGHAKNFTIHSVVNWVNSQLPSHPRLKAFLRSISPRHFFNGDWNTGGTCDNQVPLAAGSKVVQDFSGDPVAESAVRGMEVKLLDITGLSTLRDEGHISRYSIKATEGVQDCLHWCLPGIPDTWNEILFAEIVRS